MLSIVALPLIFNTTREGLQAIPTRVREAAWAVGKTSARPIRRVLLPSSGRKSSPARRSAWAA